MKARSQTDSNNIVTVLRCYGLQKDLPKESGFQRSLKSSQWRGQADIRHYCRDGVQLVQVEFPMKSHPQEADFKCHKKAANSLWRFSWEEVFVFLTHMPRYLIALDSVHFIGKERYYQAAECLGLDLQKWVQLLFTPSTASLVSTLQRALLLTECKCCCCFRYTTTYPFQNKVTECRTNFLAETKPSSDYCGSLLMCWAVSVLQNYLQAQYFACVFRHVQTVCANRAVWKHGFWDFSYINGGGGISSSLQLASFFWMYTGMPWFLLTSLSLLGVKLKWHHYNTFKSKYLRTTKPMMLPVCHRRSWDICILSFFAEIPRVWEICQPCQGQLQRGQTTFADL